MLLIASMVTFDLYVAVSPDLFHCFVYIFILIILSVESLHFETGWINYYLIATTPVAILYTCTEII